MSFWNTLILIATALATVGCTAWARRLRAAGDPAWKMAGAAALLCFVTAVLELEPTGPLMIVAILVMLLAGYWIWSSGRERRRGAA